MENITAYLLAPVSSDRIPLDIFYLLELLLLGNDQQPAFQNVQGFILQRQIPLLLMIQIWHNMQSFLTASQVRLSTAGL